MTEEKIMTLNPDPEKQGVNLDVDKYEMMKNAILTILHQGGEVKFMRDLMNQNVLLR